MRKWSQEELARRIGAIADQAVISRLENGLIPDPGSKLIFGIAKALDTTADDLLGLLVQDGAKDNAPVPTTPAPRDRGEELSEVQRQVYKLLERIEELEQVKEPAEGKRR